VKTSEMQITAAARRGITVTSVGYDSA